MLYRYRSAQNFERLLEEIREGQVYLSHPEELDDRIDCFPYIYFNGDEDIWKSFFISYIYASLSTFQIIENFSITEKNLKPSHITSTKDFVRFGKTPLHDISDKIFHDIAIFTHIISKIKDIDITSNVLLFYLNIINSLILHKGTEYGFLKDYKDRCHKAENAFNVLSQCTVDCFQFSESILPEVFIKKGVGKLDLFPKDLRNLCLSFSKEFLKNSFYNLYNSPYIASFSRTKTNHLLWYYYGGNYKGVILGFSKKEFEKCLFLYKVEYGKDKPRINFFEVLVGNIPLNPWYELWANNKKWANHWSDNNNTDFRQNKYLKSAISFQTIKHADWSSQEEERIIINPIFNKGLESIRKDFLQKQCNLDRYSYFTELIFGLDTSYEDKEQIIKVLEETYIKAPEKSIRPEFKIYQSFIKLNGEMDFSIYKNL